MSETIADHQQKMHLRSCIQRVCTGPEYSKNLPYEDAKMAMDFILSGRADPVQTSVLLVGLRMKRETDDENRGLLQGIIDRSKITTVDIDVAVKATIDAGLNALEGKAGSTKDALIYAAAICLFKADKADSFQSGAEMAKNAIESGEALKRFKA